MTGAPCPPPPNGHRRATVRIPEDELRFSARILLLLDALPRWGPSELPPAEATQAGIAQAMGLSQGAVARTLGRLVEGGAVSIERSHVPRRSFRVKTYRLTGVGEAFAERVRRLAVAAAPPNEAAQEGPQSPAPYGGR